MKLTVEAIYENGVLRPLQPLRLAEHAHVSVKVAAIEPLAPAGLNGCVGTLSASDAAELREIIGQEFEGVDERDW